MTETETANDGLVTFDDLDDEKCVVEFVMDGVTQRTELVAPTVKEVQRLREKHRKWLEAKDAENNVDAANDDGQPKSRNVSNFNFLQELEQHAAGWVKATWPSAKNKSEEAIIRKIRRIDGGVNSPLVVAAQRLCGMLLAGRAGPQIPF